MKTILIVDDEPAIIEFLEELLRPAGYHLLTALSGRQALKAIERHTGTIDLLMTDLIMPGMTGRMLADQLSARYPSIKVIFMSAFVEQARTDAEPELHYLQKPFETGTLLNMVNTLMEKRRAKAGR